MSRRPSRPFFPSLHRPARRLLAPLVAVAVAAGPLLSGHAALAAPVTPAGSVLKIWYPTYMQRGAHRTTQADAVDAAEHVDLIVAQSTQYSGYAPVMHQANPDLKLLVYVNGTMATKSEAASYPASWYLRDADGNPVRSINFGNYLMDPRQPGWIQTRVALCRRLISASGYDGCALDVLGTTPVTDATYTTGTPIDPQTGQAFDPEAWLEATTALAQQVRTALGARPLGGNGVGSGPRYFNPAFPSRQLLNGVDEGIVESFERIGTYPLDTHDTPKQWRQEVDMLVDADRRGHGVDVVTKTWSDGTQAEKDAIHEYTLATFLMGTSGASRFFFTYNQTDDLDTWNPWWDTDLGAPTGHYQRMPNGLFRRVFAHGLVLANPHANPLTVRLGGSYTTLQGDTVTSVTLAPFSGKVLTD